MRRKKIGTMDFHGSVDITDPCYNRNVWCRMTDVKIRKGVYTCIAWHHKDKGTFDSGEPYCYDVIGIIGIYLDGVIPCQKDEFFKLWHQKIFQLGSIFRKAEKVCSDHTMELAWTATFVELYLEYDTSKDFLPQFEENSEKILNLMRMMPASKDGVNHA